MIPVSGSGWNLPETVLFPVNSCRFRCLSRRKLPEKHPENGRSIPAGNHKQDPFTSGQIRCPEELREKTVFRPKFTRKLNPDSVRNSPYPAGIWPDTDNQHSKTTTFLAGNRWKATESGHRNPDRISSDFSGDFPPIPALSGRKQWEPTKGIPRFPLKHRVPDPVVSQFFPQDPVKIRIPAISANIRRVPTSKIYHFHTVKVNN